MSGYDEIRCETPLPADLGPETVFQTRAFVGVFGEPYTITSDGRLIYRRLMDVPFLPAAPEHTKPSTETEFASGSPDPVCGDVEIAFNGDLEFREFGPIPRTFFACFIDGRCERILGEGDYRDLMEKARRWALSQDVRCPVSRASALWPPHNVGCWRVSPGRATDVCGPLQTFGESAFWRVARGWRSHGL